MVSLKRKEKESSKEKEGCLDHEEIKETEYSKMCKFCLEDSQSKSN